MLREHKLALEWSISDIKGLSPSIIMHKILMKKEFKPSIEHQRMLNLGMKEVVRDEILKLLDAMTIYAILDSSQVSPIQVMPRKGGIIAVKNQNDELIPTKTITR